jgi:hypothetical protein
MIILKSFGEGVDMIHMAQGKGRGQLWAGTNRQPTFGLNKNAWNFLTSYIAIGWSRRTLLSGIT